MNSIVEKQPAGHGRLIIICGLPGAGKTTLAKHLESELNAIRFCPDEWLTELELSLWDEPLRGRLEQLQWRLGQRLLALGQTILIEWGTWGRSERDALRLGARALGAAVELRYIHVPLEILCQRVEARRAESPPITRLHMQEWARVFQAPTQEEMNRFDDPAPPQTGHR